MCCREGAVSRYADLRVVYKSCVLSFYHGCVPPLVFKGQWEAAAIEAERHNAPADMRQAIERASAATPRCQARSRKLPPGDVSDYSWEPMYSGIYGLSGFIIAD